MTISADILRTHLAYTDWASQRLVNAASQLTDEELNRDFHTSERSVLGTLVHIYGADRVWLQRFQGEQDQRWITDADRSLAVLQNEWPSLCVRRQEWAAALTDAAVMESLTYFDLKDNRWTQPLWQLILHVVNHGTHHRGQAAGFIRSLGRVPPPLDLVAYYRELDKSSGQTG